MTLRYLLGAVTAAGLVWSMNVGVASAQTPLPEGTLNPRDWNPRDGGLLPARGDGMVVVAGCLIRGDQIAGGRNKYALGNPVKGPIESVAEETCSVDYEANGLTLDKHKWGGLDDTLLGRMIEITGRLERETNSGSSLRELDVWSARVLPKTPAPPQVAVVEEVTIEPAPPAAAPAPSPEPAPVPTTGVAPALPQTAGAGPTIGLIGLFALGASVLLRTVPATRRG